MFTVPSERTCCLNGDSAAGDELWRVWRHLPEPLRSRVSLVGIETGVVFNGEQDMNQFDMALAYATGRSLATSAVGDPQQVGRQSLQLQALQTGLLAQMSNSIGAIHAQVAQARADQAEALALQQEMLAREQLQSHLEEFVYQAEKLVSECQKSNSDLAPSTRYYLLDGVVQQIEQDGIGTAVIRGRDNKAAFERVFKEVQQLRTALKADPDVISALAWAAKLDKQRAEQRRQIEAKMRPYQLEIEKLQSGRNPLTFRDAWAKWKKKVSGWVSPQYKVAVIVLLALASPILIFAVPYLLIAGLAVLRIDKNKMNKELNAKTDSEIESFEAKLRPLREKLDTV